MPTRKSPHKRAEEEQRVLQLRRTDFTLDFSVTVDKEAIVLVGLAISGEGSDLLDASDVELNVVGSNGPYNTIGFPAEGPLPYVSLGKARAAIATYRFMSINRDDPPAALTGRIRAQGFSIRLDDPRYAASTPQAVPLSVREAVKKAPAGKAGRTGRQ